MAGFYAADVGRTGRADTESSTPPIDLRTVRQLLTTIVPPVVIAIVFLGPGLGRGALMNLDLMVLPRMEVPPGVWGLGPEFPRRVPLWFPITAISSVVPATVTVKLLLVAIFVIGWCGMVRWARSLGVARPEVAAGLYLLSPFLLTRLGVGHIGLMLAAAVLPWVAPRLLRPTDDLRRLFLAAAAIGLSGYAGGMLAMIVVSCSAFVNDPRAVRRNLAAIGVTVLAQTPWVLPSVLVTMAISTEAASALPFGVQVGNPLQVFSLSAGHGYWNTYFQVGSTGWLVTAVGAGLLALGIYGTPRLPDDVRRPLAVLGGSAWVLAALSAFSWADPILDGLTRTAVGGLLRDPHRFFTLHLLWLAPTVCLGAARLHDELVAGRFGRLAGAVPVLPLAAIVIVSTPGVWGLGGNLAAVPVPGAWDEVRDQIRASPGPTLALPWALYLNQDLPGAPVRRVLNPMPYLIDGDVISSSDNRLGDEVREAGDPREPIVTDTLVGLIEDGTAVSPVLERLGVRWIVLQTTTPLSDRYAALRDDPGVTVELERPELTLFSVTDWPGHAFDSARAAVPVSAAGGVLYRLDGDSEGGDGDGPAVVARAGSGGWMLGWSRASVNDDGLLVVPRRSGIVWNVATPLMVVGQLVFAAVVCWTFLLVRRQRGLVKSPDSR